MQPRQQLILRQFRELFLWLCGRGRCGRGRRSCRRDLNRRGCCRLWYRCRHQGRGRNGRRWRRSHCRSRRHRLHGRGRRGRLFGNRSYRLLRHHRRGGRCHGLCGRGRGRRWLPSHWSCGRGGLRGRLRRGSRHCWRGRRLSSRCSRFLSRSGSRRRRSWL
jgi:hypothetical protein